MNRLVTQVKEYIRSHGLLSHDRPVVVAVSGGADSVALLAVLLDLGYDCVSAHCNFHLRGEESMRDTRHVERLTERLGVDLYIKDFDVPARQAITGESLEMACRELRYEWFGQLLDKVQGQVIAVGHHREDQVETFFINLLRGSSIAGLAGMKPHNGNVVRPLLDCSRADIEAYLSDKGIDWIVDSTNAEDIFTRNRLRNRLIPMLNELFDGASDAILRTMHILAENRQLYSRAVDEAATRYRDADGQIDLAALSADPLAGLLLYEMVGGEGFSRRQTDDMLTAASRHGGSFTAAHSSHTRDVDHGILRASHAGGAPTDDAVDISLKRDITTPVNIKVSLHLATDFKPTRNPHVIYIDSRALDGQPVWQLRRYRRGDRMAPYGMDGTKLVSDIFAQARLSREAKADSWLLTRNGTIMWVVGLRASRHFAVTADTRQYLQLELIDNK